MIISFSCQFSYVCNIRKYLFGMKLVHIVMKYKSQLTAILSLFSLPLLDANAFHISVWCKCVVVMKFFGKISLKHTKELPSHIIEHTFEHKLFYLEFEWDHTPKFGRMVYIQFNKWKLIPHWLNDLPYFFILSLVGDSIKY